MGNLNDYINECSMFYVIKLKDIELNIPKILVEQITEDWGNGYQLIKKGDELHVGCQVINPDAYMDIMKVLADELGYEIT